MTDEFARPIVAFRRAVELIERDHLQGREGPASAIARLVGVTRQATSQILTKPNTLCPAAWVVPLARATGVPRSSLRPDLYPVEDDPDLKARRSRPTSPVALERDGQLCIPGTERKRAHG